MQGKVRGQRRQRPRHAHGRDDRGGGERDRHRRSRSEREDRWDQGGQRRRLLLPRSGRLRVHVGRDAQRRRDQQQLLRRPVALQLPQRSGPARHLESRAAGDLVRDAAGDDAWSRPRATRPTTWRTPRRTRPAPTTRTRCFGRSTTTAPSFRPRSRASSASPRTATRQLKSFYSSYGVGSADVVAPGGDSILQLTAAAPNGRVLSTWPASLLTVTCLPARRSSTPPARRTATSRERRWPRHTSPVSQRSSTASPERVTGRGRGQDQRHGRSDRLPARPVDLRLLPGGRQRSAAGVPGRHRLQLLQRSRPGERTVCH